MHLQINIHGDRLIDKRIDYSWKISANHSSVMPNPSSERIPGDNEGNLLLSSHIKGRRAVISYCCVEIMLERCKVGCKSKMHQVMVVCGVTGSIPAAGSLANEPISWHIEKDTARIQSEPFPPRWKKNQIPEGIVF